MCEYLTMSIVLAWNKPSDFHLVDRGGASDTIGLLLSRNMSNVIAVGLQKGHAVTKRTLAPRPGSRKGVSHTFFIFMATRFTNSVLQRCGKRVGMIRSLIRDVAGSAPYEKRLVELLKTGRDKRALKLAKRKVSGWH